MSEDIADYLDELREALASHDAALGMLRLEALERKLAPALPPTAPEAPTMTMGGDVSQAGAAGALARQFTGGLAVVTCLIGGTVYVISTSTRAVVAILGTPGQQQPFGVALTPAGDYGAYAWMTSSNSYDGIVYSLASFVRAGWVFPYTYGVAVSPDGAHAYVSVNDGYLYEFATATGTGTGRFLSVGTAYYIAATADYLYLPVTSGGNSVRVVRLLDFTHVATVTLPPGGFPWGAAVSPDGAWVYVSDANLDYVYVIRTSDNTLYTTISLGGGVRSLAVTPAGDYVWVALAEGDQIVAIRASDNVVQSPITVSGSPESVAITPDGTEVWVTSSGSNKVWPVRISDGYVYDAIPVGQYPYNIAIGG